jgi:putative two-component system response regulator
LPLEEALDYMYAQAGSHFDPQLIPAFKKALPEILKIHQTYADD